MIDPSWYVRPEGAPTREAAGGVVVRLQGGRVWVAVVKENDHPDCILPKGVVEPGESLEDAARREIAEEAGLSDLTLSQLLGVEERLSFNRKWWKRTHYFLFTTRQEVGEPTDQQHGYRCLWFLLEELPPMLWPEQRRLLEDNRELITRLCQKQG